MANKSSQSGQLGVKRVKVIAASVRTTSRMNTLLNESIMQAQRKKSLAKLKEIIFDNDEQQQQQQQQNEKNKIKIIYYHKNFNMEHVYKLIVETIDERLQWDRFNRMYDPWRTPQFTESLSKEIKDRVKELNYPRHRIVCILSIVEKQQQGIDYKMMHLMDEKIDNFTNYVHERGTYSIIATVWLVHKE